MRLSLNLQSILYPFFKGSTSIGIRGQFPLELLVTFIRNNGFNLNGIFQLGVIYPVQEDRRDISLVNGMAYIAGGAIYGDVIKSINYVDDDSNQGSMYDLNNGKVRLGNKFKGLLIDITNNVFKLFGVRIEFRNADDQLVSQISEDGSAFFAQGNALFDKDGNVFIKGNLQTNHAGNRVVLSSEDRSLAFLSKEDVQVAKLGYYVTDNPDRKWASARLDMQSLDDDGQLARQQMWLTAAGLVFKDETNQASAQIAAERIILGNFSLGTNPDHTIDLNLHGLPQSKEGLKLGSIWNDQGTLRIV